MGAVMYFALRSLGVSVASSLAASLVPAVLGALNVLTRIAYTLSALALIVACGSILASEYHFRLSDLPKIVHSWFK
jgi:uncharacterized membrane protein YuzA (DUF378 family)